MKLLRLLSVFCALSFLSLPISAENVYTITETELVTLESNLREAQAELMKSQEECQTLKTELQTVSTLLKESEAENNKNMFSVCITSLLAGGIVGGIIGVMAK